MLVNEFLLFVHYFSATHSFSAFYHSTGAFERSQLSTHTCVFEFTVALHPVWTQTASEQVPGGGSGPVWEGRLRDCAPASFESKTLENTLEATQNT